MASPFNTEAAFAQSGGGWGRVRQYDLDEVGRVTSFKGEFEQSKKCTFAMKGNVKSRWR